MTDEEMAKQFANNIDGLELIGILLGAGDESHAYRLGRYEGFLAGLKASEPKWHKVSDGDLPKGEEYGKNSIHRKIYLKDRYGNLYTGNYYSKDETHKEDCFAVEFLEWGFQGSQFCAKEQISE